MEKLKMRTHGLLRWSEKYFKTDMVYLAKGGFWLTLGYGGQIISGLILTIALANLISKEAYGTYQFVISVGAIIGGFTLSGMGTALMRTVARGSKGTLQYAFKTQLTWSVGAVLAGGMLALYYFLNNNVELAIAFLVIGACVPFLSGFSLYRPYLEGMGFFRESTMLGIWRRPLPVISVLFALLLTNDPIVLVLTYFLSQTISIGLLYRLIVRRYPESSEPNQELLTYSKHLSVMGIVGIVANNVDKMLVFHFLGAAPVAIYTLAQLPSTHILKMFSLAGNLVFKKFARRDLSTLKEMIAHKIGVFSIATIAVVSVYIVAAPYIFKFVFPAYQEAVLLSQILILAVLLKPFMLYTQVFASHGLKRAQYFIQISTTIIKLSLLLVLLPIYGLWGAVWTTLIASLYWGIIAAILFYSKKISDPQN